MLCGTMLVGALLSNAIADVYASERAANMKSVFSIDAGRKYFSEAQLIDIIENAYHMGYTDVQILLGNDALRFFLDDMSMTVNGKTYASEAVKAALTVGNKAYYDDPNGNALTETEMNHVIAFAKEKDMRLIPVINSPGHMDAILLGMEELGLTDVRYSNNGKQSDRTVNIENDEATEFTKTLIKKYVDYFGNSSVCDIFNFGADEYANDVFTSPGWGELQRLGIYDRFIGYANEMAGIIKAAGMKPMCFNDGIYYNSKDNYGAFDQDIIISYWTSGWWGFYVAKPEFFANKGHKILNTNDAWYWVLGNVDSGSYNYNSVMTNIGNKQYNEVTGATSDIATIGSMQCVWADNPDAAYDAERLTNLMKAFSEKHATILIRPADYTNVNEAIKKVPADLENYTEETVLSLNNALNAVIKNKRAGEQDTVNGYAIAIENAITELKLKAADYSDVEAAIHAIPTDLSIYTEASMKKLNEAKAAVIYGLTIKQQATVDQMAANIHAAIQGLTLKEGQDSTVVTPNKPAGNPAAGDKPNKDKNEAELIKNTAADPLVNNTFSLIAIGAMLTYITKRISNELENE